MWLLQKPATATTTTGPIRDDAIWILTGEVASLTADVAKKDVIIKRLQCVASALVCTGSGGGGVSCVRRWEQLKAHYVCHVSPRMGVLLSREVLERTRSGASKEAVDEVVRGSGPLPALAGAHATIEVCVAG